MPPRRWTTIALTGLALLALCTLNPAFPAPQRTSNAIELESARRLLQAEKWQEAAAAFRRILKQNPRDADAEVGLGIALWGSGDRQGAYAEFSRATEIDPKSARAHYNVGLAWKGLGEADQAIQSVKRALTLMPDFEEARLALGLMLQQKGNIDGAVAEYQRVLKGNPRSADAHNWLGVAFMQKNKLVEAIDEFRQAVRWKPDFVRAYNNLGSTLAQSGELQSGIEAFETGLKHAPEDLQLHLNLGTALRTAGESEEAIRHFEVVLKRNPGDFEVHQQLGQTYRQSGDLDAAIREFESVLQLNPESREGYYNLGQTLRQKAAGRPKRTSAEGNAALAESMRQGSGSLALGDVRGAVEHFRQAVARDDQSADAHNALGFALGRAGNLPGAVASLTQAVTLAPDLPEAHFNLGAALWYSGDRARASAEFDEAIRLDPASAEACSFRGIAYREGGDLASARKMLQRAIALSPKLPASYFDLGVLFVRMNQTERALGQFEAGLNLPASPGKPPDLEMAINELRSALAKAGTPEGHNILGRLLGLAGAVSKQVVTEFETAVRLRPGYAEAYNNLGLVYVQTGDDEKADAAFRAAIQHAPNFADAHANLGALLTTAHPSQAVRELEKALALQPELLKARYNLALAYEASPSHGEAKAIEQLRQLVATDADYPRAAFALAKALLRQGAVEEAVAHFEHALRLEPQSGEVHYQYGLALARAGRQSESVTELTKGRDLVAAARRDEMLRLDLMEGRTALDDGDPEQALTKFRRAAQQRPDLAEPHYWIGLALAQKGDTTGAIAALGKTLEVDPGHFAARQKLTALSPKSHKPSGDSEKREVFESYIRDSRFDELEPLLRAYVKEKPESSWGWYALGYTYFAQQKVRESIEALSKSLSLDVTNAEAHKVLGRNLMTIGRFDAARVEFEQGVRYNPNSAEIHYNLGKLYSIQDLWPDARRAFEQALRLDPNYMEAYDGLGFAMESLGDDGQAIANYESAARINEARGGRFSAPYVNLSALYSRIGKNDKALECARQAVELNPKSDRGWFYMAKAHERQGDLDAAVNALTQAVMINPKSSSAYYVLSTVYRRQGKQEESRAAMEVFSKLERENRDLERRRRDGRRQQDTANE